MDSRVNHKVRDAYDRIADAYAAQRDRFASLEYLERCAAILPVAAKVLDVGCGAGLPVDRFLVGHGCDVTGIDISPRMIDLARRNVPEATFEVRDMSELAAGEYSVGGIVSFYAIFHTPRDQHAALFATLRSFLPGGGALLVTMGGGEWEGSEADFHGAEMHWSHYGPRRNREIVEAAGFEVVLDEIDNAAGERHQVILARVRQQG